MIKGIIFDLNGTLIDIATDEWSDDVYRVTANFLRYCQVNISPETLKERYFALNREQRRRSREEFPEFDAVKIFQTVIDEFRISGSSHVEYSHAYSAAQVFRAAGLRKLELYSGVREVLDSLKHRYHLGAVSDGQSAWAVPELLSAGLGGYFSPVVVSGDHGFRKPDDRMFSLALEAMQLPASEVVMVGNDMYRDVYGGHGAGMKTVFFRSNQGDWEFREVEADYIIYDFRELPEALAFLEN